MNIKEEIKENSNMLDFAFYEINTLFRHLTPLEEEVEKLKKEVEKLNKKLENKGE